MLFRSVCLTLLLLISSIVTAQYPDGTLVFSNKKGLVGNVARRISGGDHYTHVGIVIDGYVYESDWPKAVRTPVANYGKPRTTNDYYTPKVQANIANMRAKAVAMLGTPYSLKGYKGRRVGRNGQWCSPYVGKVLIAGGWKLSASHYHEPQDLLTAVQPYYEFVGRVRR